MQVSFFFFPSAVRESEGRRRCGALGLAWSPRRASDCAGCPRAPPRVAGVQRACTRVAGTGACGRLSLFNGRPSRTHSSPLRVGLRAPGAPLLTRSLPPTSSSRLLLIRSRLHPWGPCLGAEKMAGGRLLLGGDFLSPPQLPPLPPPPPPPLPPPPPEPVLEQWRYSHESDWQWALRRSFICRHLHSYPGAALDQLLALSAAWTNHVFLGCR